jgi:hypothetical protein
VGYKADVSAQIGADDLELFQGPQPDLLEEISGIRPEPGGLHVLLDQLGVRSTQRLALSGFGGGYVVALWPAELKEQAKYLYGRRLAKAMVREALERGWLAEGAPQLAFRSSPAAQRLYMKPTVEALEYAGRWENGDLVQVGQYEATEVRRVLWPWLKERGYVEDRDDPMLEGFLSEQLGNRPAFFRPGLRLRGRWQAEAVRAGGPALVAQIRADVNAILTAANEPTLPAGRS